MNKDYAVPGRICSDNGIYEAFYREVGKPRQNAPCVIRARVTGWLRAVFAVLCSAAVRRVLRAVSATAADASSQYCGSSTPYFASSVASLLHA